jgi:general secretion pathway protein D
VVDNADQVRLALNLLAENSEVNVLSSPSLMVLDNQTATINVGDEIPVPARQSISNLDPVSPTVNEITFRQTGVTLSVTPRVNNSGLVTMEIQQEVASAAATTTSNIDAPTIQNRAIESVVAINSGDTIVLGGLMQNRQSVSEGGVPGLRRIPGLGKLFGSASHENSKTELLVLITPRVVRNRDDARSITEELRQKLPQLHMAEPEPAAPEPSS